MSSASLQPSVIDNYLHRELAKGRIALTFLQREPSYKA